VLDTTTGSAPALCSRLAREGHAGCPLAVCSHRTRETAWWEGVIAEVVTVSDHGARAKEQ